MQEIILDIETGNPTPEALQKERLTIKPDGRSKTEAAIAASKEKKLKEGGLLNLAPIACIGTICDGVHYNFNAFPLTMPMYASLLQERIIPLSFPDERTMLAAFCAMMEEQATLMSVLVTHNGKSFDAPKIRTRSAFYNLQGTWFLSPENRDQHFDTQQRFGWSFAHRGEEQKYVSLERVCASLNVDFTKEGIGGPDVPDAVDRGEYVEVIIYNQRDCVATQQAYHKMRRQM